MKKYIIGAIIGAIFVSAGVALANGHGMMMVDKVWMDSGFGGGSWVQKIYDQDTNTICYAMTNGSAGSSISCLKNN